MTVDLSKDQQRDCHCEHGIDIYEALCVQCGIGELAPHPWRLWKVGERSDLPHIADATGRVVVRAEGNIWIWQDFIGPMIVAAVNGNAP